MLLAVMLLMLASCAGSQDPNGPTAASATGTATQPGSQLVESGAGETVADSATVQTGAQRLVAEDFQQLAGQRIGLIVNQASVVGHQHIVDLALASPNVEVAALFAPEHGVRGDAAAGERVADETDPLNRVRVYSVYGNTRKPTSEMLAGIDTLVFDLQDVGTRYYTYISTLGLAMQAAAEADVAFVVLDRPNPLGGQIISGFTPRGVDSFISQYPIPSVYGLTAGELASAIVGESWLPNLDDLDLTVVEMAGWRRSQTWADTGLAWVPPSPGLPTVETALVYPATVLFEATSLSYGQGTDEPFQIIGAEWLDSEALSQTLNGFGLAGVSFEPVTFVPQPDAVNTAPKLQANELHGVRLNVADQRSLDATVVGVYLLAAVQAQAFQAGQGSIVDNGGLLDLLAGSTLLGDQLGALTVENSAAQAAALTAGWAAGSESFETLREPYLRYR